MARKDRQQAKNGAPYLSLELRDRTGSIPARIFREVAGRANDPGTRAEAHFNAYQTALSAGRNDEALAEYRQAVALDPARFSLFPRKYEPIRILGAGGFGTAFLCQMRLSQGQVVVKTLRREDLDRG